MTHRTLHPFSYLDGLVIVSCVAGALSFWPLVQSHRPATVAVFRDDTKIAEYPLSTPRVVTLRGRHGDVTLSVRDNGVCVVSADCPRQVCVREGTIRQNGQQIVCAPNHILIELQASSGNAVDAVTK